MNLKDVKIMARMTLTAFIAINILLVVKTCAQPKKKRYVEMKYGSEELEDQSYDKTTVKFIKNQ